jgi:hypothetical protein
MPFAPSETSVKSVRESVASWGCNAKKPRVAGAGKKKRTAKKGGAKKVKPKTESADALTAAIQREPAQGEEAAQGEASEASVATEIGGEPGVIELRGSVGLANSAQ